VTLAVACPAAKLTLPLEKTPPTKSLADAAAMGRQFKEIFGVDFPLQDLANLKSEAGFAETFNELLNPFYKSPKVEVIKQAAVQAVGEVGGQLEKIFADPEVYKASQALVLEIIDNNWSRHLELMEILKEESGLFSYASQDPLIDYILESKKLFEQMGEGIQTEFLQTIFCRISK
jgi:preprotein translocase subunit SecA